MKTICFHVKLIDPAIPNHILFTYQVCFLPYNSYFSSFHARINSCNMHFVSLYTYLSDKLTTWTFFVSVEQHHLSYHILHNTCSDYLTKCGIWFGSVSKNIYIKKTGFVNRKSPSAGWWIFLSSSIHQFEHDTL